MLLLGLFAALALVLAAVGIHGVLSYTVAQRHHEIGIRMALGAHPRRVTGLVLWQGMRLAGVGVAIGVAGALLSTRLLRGLLFGVAPTDVAAIGVALPVLAVVALLATYFPARRAVRIAPLEAIRSVER
jgi:putative ABC transport system permease protein